METSEAMEVNMDLAVPLSGPQLKQEMASDVEFASLSALPEQAPSSAVANDASPRQFTELTAVPVLLAAPPAEPPPPPPPQPEPAAAAAAAQSRPKHTEPLIQRDNPANDDTEPYSTPEQPPPPLPSSATTEEQPPEPLYRKVARLDKAEVLNIVLSGGRPVNTPAVIPERLQLSLPKEGFMCDQCGDRFLLPSSLALHQGRRTMQIFYNCPDCASTCVFDNKCRFIEHLDGHGRSPESLDPEAVEVSALSLQELSCPARVLPALGSRVLTGPPQMVQMAPRPQQDRTTSISCPMCNTLCTTTTVSEHMCPPAGPDSLLKMPPRCPECAQPCPSECALLAHHGLHKANLFPYPYVCPECSVKMLGSHEDYRRHVVAHCLHLTRDLKNCCSICLIEVGDIRSHILQTHVQNLYKCRKCPLAFESINGFNGHVQLKHGNEPMFGETPYMPIIKCPFCAATFNHQKTLREHLVSKKHVHQLEQVRFVFRCPECDIDYGRKELLSDHLAQNHPDFQIANMDIADPIPPDDEQESAPPPPPVEVRRTPTRPPGVRMGRPPKNMPFMPPVVQQHLVKAAELLPTERPASRRSLHSCIVCKAAFRRKSAYMEHARQHLSDGVPLCLLCNKDFQSEEELKHHIADHASEIGRDRCGLCYAKLGSRDQLQYHLEAEHNLRNFTCPLCQLRFSRLNDLHRHNFSKHRGSGKGGRPPARPQQEMLAISAPPLPPLDDDDEDDDIPLSALGAKKPRVNPPALKKEVHDSGVDGTTPGGKRKRAGAVDRNAGKAGKRARADGEPTMPRLSRVSRSQSPDEKAFVEKPTPKMPSSGYRCVCCGYQTDARGAFVEHVAQHRQPGQHQCPECGQCYSTKPSLLKHLLLVHRQRKMPPELAEAERQQEALKWETLTKTLESGQCQVCRTKCGDEKKLLLHMRSHGRTALRAYQREVQRRQRRAKKEVRAETLEDIASFVAGGQTWSSQAEAEAMEEEEDDDEEDGVIELEMKEGEITTKQLRKAGVPLQVRPDESSDEEESMENTFQQGNGTEAADESQPAAVAQPRETSIERELARMDGDGSDQRLAAVAADIKALTKEAAAPPPTANGHPPAGQAVAESRGEPAEGAATG